MKGWTKARSFLSSRLHVARRVINWNRSLARYLLVHVLPAILANQPIGDVDGNALPNTKTTDTSWPMGSRRKIFWTLRTICSRYQAIGSRGNLSATVDEVDEALAAHSFKVVGKDTIVLPHIRYRNRRGRVGECGQVVHVLQRSQYTIVVYHLVVAASDQI